jgi:hypothetical protein
MKTSTKTRLVRLAGLLLLSVLALTLIVPAAQARHLSSARERLAAAGSTTSSSTQHPVGWTWGYYYSDAGKARLLALGAQPGHYVAFPPNGAAGSAQAASSGVSSTTVWIVALAVLGAVFVVGAWLLTRRRQHRAPPMCEAGTASC